MKIDLIFSLRAYFDTFNVNILHVTPPFEELKTLDGGLRNFLNPSFDWQKAGQDMLSQANPNTFYLSEDILGCKYALFEIPNEKDSVYIIGPWRGSERTNEQIDWVKNRLGDECELGVSI